MCSSDLKVNKMRKKGYSVGIWGVDHPKYKVEVQLCEQLSKLNGVDYRYKEFLGELDGKLYGNYKYPEHMKGKVDRCECKPSEMLIAPNGDIFRCHRDLYEKPTRAYASLRDEHVHLMQDHVLCVSPKCNPCDGKIKYDRFQQDGHCSVDIKESR